MADFLALQDLFNRVGQETIEGYFDDSHNGVLTDESTIVDEVLSAAEGALYARMLRAYPGDPSDAAGAMQALVQNDPSVKVHCSWVAVQMAAERRPAFTDNDGNGPYKVQYDRAIEHFELLSKGTLRSQGETEAGQGANTGGKLQPKPPGASYSQFVFAPGRDAPSGHGGF